MSDKQNVLIEVKDLKKHFREGTIHALDGVSMDDIEEKIGCARQTVRYYYRMSQDAGWVERWRDSIGKNCRIDARPQGSAAKGAGMGEMTG